VPAVASSERTRLMRAALTECYRPAGVIGDGPGKVIVVGSTKVILGGCQVGHLPTWSCESVWGVIGGGLCSGCSRAKLERRLGA